MRKIGKYETPEIEITKFEIARGIMADVGVGEGGTSSDGDIVESSGEWESDPDAGGDAPIWPQ